MQFFSSCLSRNAATPWGEVWLAASAQGLCGLWFTGQAYFPENLLAMRSTHTEHSWAMNAHLDAAQCLLQNYAEGQIAPFSKDANNPPLALDLRLGTAFPQSVWQMLLTIPYGAQCTYGQLASAMGRPHAARAVGAAIARNPISILLPCHRVVGSNGRLTGYAGGLARKQALLLHEAACLASQQA